MPRRAAGPRTTSVLTLPIVWIALATSAPAFAQAHPFTLVALPDTQHYTCTNGASCVADEQIFETQTAWIAANRDAIDVRFVAGLGDCVQDGDDTDHFAIAHAALATLESATGDGYPDGIPFGLAVGNRDQFPSGDPGSIPAPTDALDPGQTTTTATFNAWFGVDRFCPGSVCRSYYGDHFGLNNDNHYALFDAGDYRFVVVHVEYMPTDSSLRQAVLSWADDVLATHADRRAIVVSHHVLGTGVNAAFSDQGAALYEQLEHHPNLFLILGGHITGEGRRTDVREGHTVHTVLADYQGRGDGGAGWLRLLEFRPAEDLISVRTWSPWLDAWEADGSSEFTLAYDMGGGAPDPCDAEEVCDPGDVDEDCDGLSDDADDSATGQVAWLLDADGDGYGDPASPITACDPPAGYAADEDCDDADPTVNGDAAEVCNGRDDDCDGGLDEEQPDADADGVCDALDVCLDGWPDLDGDQVCNPGLDQTPMVAGQLATLTLTNAPGGSRATFLLSMIGHDGPALCLAVAPSVCTTLRGPLMLGSAIADGQGRASLQVFVPVSLRAVPLHLQGLWLGGGAGQVSEIDVVVP